MRKFINKRGDIFDSFLVAVEKGSYSTTDINTSAIYSFLVYGALYFEDTFISDIQKIFSHQNNIIDQNLGFIPEKIQVYNPLEESLIKNPEELFIEFFQKRKPFFEEKKISVDLTGGIDSRLIATVLNYLEIPFDSFFSLEVGGIKELEIVKRVAEELKVELKLVNPSTSKINIDFLFEISDGLWDILAIESLVSSQTWRKEKKYDLVITGVGGELYKDFWWLQDFPFYNKSEIDLERLINYRMYPMNEMLEWWGSDKVRIDEFEEKFRVRLSKYIVENNTRTYDQIYYNVKIKEMVSVLSRTTSFYIDTYSPFLESDLLRIGYNLKRKERFFNFFHRRLISNLNTKVSKIPTTEGGVSVSTDMKYLAKDYIYYAKDKIKKVAGKMIKKEERSINIVDRRYIGLSEEIESCLKIIKDNGVFSKEAPNKYLEVPSKLWGRILTVGTFLKKLEN